MTDDVTLSPAEATDLARTALMRVGMIEGAAIALAGAIVAAEMAGKQPVGFAHLTDYLRSLVDGRIAGRAEPLLTSPVPAILKCDAMGGVAQHGGSVANIFDGCEEDFLRFVHAGLALKFCSSIATTSVSALGPMLKARSTMRASPRMSPVKLKIAAWPLRRARMTSKPLIVA